MSKTLTLAALFFAASVAATATLRQLSAPPAPAMASGTDTAAEVTRRGSRDPLAADTAIMLGAGNQARRGQRPELASADSHLTAPAVEGQRRGSR